MSGLLKVAKFGGTSMADLSAMQRCANIILKDPDKRIIVVSATSGTTNKLTQICDAKSDEDFKKLLLEIRKKHVELSNQLKADTLLKEIEYLLDELEDRVQEGPQFSGKERDEILSFGERLSSLIFTEVLSQQSKDMATWMDVRNIIKTDDTYGEAEPDILRTEKAAKHIINDLHKTRFVTQGFIGESPDGSTTTLGRGGSDFSAALFAEAVNADVLEIWTDVVAIYTTDPRIVPDAKPILELSFNEAAELSVFGAKVLHPATIKPAIRKNIKVYVGSSISPGQPGTWIVKETKSKPVVRAMSLRKNQTLLTVHSLDMLHRHGFLAKLFSVLSKYKISVDLVTTSEVSVSLTLDDLSANRQDDLLTGRVIKELRSFCDVQVEKQLSLIALVGNNLNATAGLSGPVFSELENVNIRLICHGASSHNLCFLVHQKDSGDVLKKLHARFITKKDVSEVNV